MLRNIPQWAQERIYNVRESKQIRLSLRPPLNEQNNKLVSVPNSVFSLTKLEELDLSGNFLNDISPNLNRLTALKKLYLADNLFTYIPDAIAQLHSLENLNLSGNRLDTLPDTLKQLRNLRTLSLNRNWFTSVPQVLVQLVMLQELYLANNQLQTVSNDLANLTDLHTFRLDGNRLAGFPTVSCYLPNLQVLGLDRNRLSLLPNEVDKLENLRELYLYDNNLTIIPDTISFLKKLSILWLGNNELTVVPNVLGTLTGLEKLDLSQNGLTNLSFAITKLSKLRVLYLSDNKLTTISQPLSLLTHLQELYLTGNQFNSLPDEVTQIKRLQKLSLRDNPLQDISDTISKLSDLRELDLSYNEITSLTDALVELTNLQTLDLSGNQLTILPHWLVQLPRLKTLYLYRNPINRPPPELLEVNTFKSVDLFKLRTYFRQLAEQGHNYFYEAKMLIVGEPYAGKTTLARKLLNPSAPLPAPNERTEGIDVHTWTFPVPSNSLQPVDDGQQKDDLPNHSYFRVNIWDFGGQEIYHSTHQFFLTRRSLYVVVADAREQKTSFFHWLDSIEHLSDASPTLILNNEKEDTAWSVNENQLRSHFANLKEGLFAVNLATNRGLERLRQAIQYHITHLPHVGQELPCNWVAVRKTLENKTCDYFSLDEFLRLCDDHGFSRLEDKLQLSGYLHDLGVILHFQEDLLLKKTVILKPEWATDAVYRLLDSKQVQASLGRFDRADLLQIWHDDKYVLMHDELLALMEKFQLCYQIPTHPGTYIAPQLLSEQPPSYTFVSENKANSEKLLLLRYKYETFMPKGILSRFIVALHEYIAGQQLVWRSGVVLEKDGTQAEVVEWYHLREISIRVTGAQKRDLLTTIVHEMDKLHRPFHRLKYDKLIPCNCTLCRQAVEPYFYRLDSLKRRVASKKYEVECDYSFENVDVWSLIDDIGARERFLGGDDERAFIDQTTLLRQIEVTFNDEEVKDLCFKLGVAYEDLPVQGRNNKMRELISHLDRRGRLLELVAVLKQERPNQPW